MHQISVLGDTEDILRDVTPGDGIKTKAEGDRVTFFSESGEAIDSLKEELCRGISKIILRKYSVPMLCQFADLDEYGFSEEEKKIIHSDFIASRDKGDSFIKKELSEFLKGAKSISVDGFVKFRLSRYKDYLRKKLDGYEARLEAVREYDDLIELLKIYIDTLPPIEETINVNISPSGGYSLFNKNLTDITEECIKNVIGIKKVKEMSFDELLLTCLICAAPGSIVIHNEKFSKTPEIIIVIKRIFEGKVTACPGCALCNANL